ncbi:MAG: hypothetical protein WCR19_03020, partial [Acholeplasmataceae bacterium]
TTFAWFTLTNTSTVQAFEAQIVADSGIEVALGDFTTVAGAPDQANWVTTLTSETVEAYLVAKYGNTQIFNHVTTADGINFFTLGSSAMTGTSGGYIELPLNFRSDTANQINWTTVTLSSTTYSWTVDKDFTDVLDVARTAGSQIPVDASNGMRIAMISDATYGNDVVAYEKPVGGQNVVLGAGGNLKDGVAVDEGNAGAMNYYFAKNASLPFGIEAVTTLATITDLGASGQVVSSLFDVSLITAVDFGADYYGQVMVRIWLEGWDANTYNSILSQKVSSTFTFQGVTV